MQLGAVVFCKYRMACECRIPILLLSGSLLCLFIYLSILKTEVYIYGESEINIKEYIFV